LRVKTGEGVVVNESIGPWRKNIRSWECLFKFSGTYMFCSGSDPDPEDDGKSFFLFI